MSNCSSLQVKLEDDSTKFSKLLTVRLERLLETPQSDVSVSHTDISPSVSVGSLIASPASPATSPGATSVHSGNNTPSSDSSDSSASTPARTHTNIDMSSTSALNCIPRFTGDSNCRTFLTRFEAVAGAQKWEDAIKIGYFTALMGDGPCQWLQALDPKYTADFATLKKAFTDRYGPTDYALKKAYTDCKQSATQSTRDYIEEVQAHGRKLGKTEEQIFDRVIVGLHPSKAEHLLSQQPADLDKLIKLAKLQADLPNATPATEVTSLFADFKKELKADISKMWDNMQHHVEALVVPRQLPRPRPIISNQAAASTPRPRPTSPGPRVHFASKQIRPNGKYQPSISQANRCTRCLSRAHESFLCPFKHQQCYRCHGYGHTQIACTAPRPRIQ